MIAKNKYNEMMDRIEPPEHLKSEVLTIAHTLAENEKNQAAKLSSQQFRGRVIKIVSASAVACVCLFVLILFGGISNHENPDLGNKINESFTLRAYASEPDIVYENSEDIITLGKIGGEQMSYEKGVYSGCLFNIEGEGIGKVDISLSKGGLYAYAEEDYTRNSEEDTITAENRAFEQVAERLGGEYNPETTLDSSDDETLFTVSACRHLGQSFSLPYSDQVGEIDLSDIALGFWLPGSEIASEEMFDTDLREGWQESLNSFDGELLKVTVHFLGGTQLEKSYLLKVGKMKYTYFKDVAGREKLKILPELAVENETYFYGLYAVEI